MTTHKTMAEAQAVCRELRASSYPKLSPEADAIEAEWRGNSEYESDYAWLMRKQAGV